MQSLQEVYSKGEEVNRIHQERAVQVNKTGNPAALWRGCRQNAVVQLMKN